MPFGVLTVVYISCNRSGTPADRTWATRARSVGGLRRRGAAPRPFRDPSEASPSCGRESKFLSSILDLSYDFGAVPRFVKALDAGADQVMGSRFKGVIEKGAMPPLHRWLGNPVLTGLGRLLFRTDVSDFHCGLRGFRRSALEKLDLRTTGMEYASEMVVKAALFGLTIREIPVTLRRDGRSRPPHLRTWRDGWRHLRFLLLYSPRWLFLLPGVALALLGAALILWLLPGPRAAFGATWDVHTMLGGAAFVLVGAQAVFFGVCAKIFGITEGLLPKDAVLERLFDLS